MKKTYLEGDVLPVRGVDSLDYGDGVLELAAPAEELAVQCYVLWEFCGEKRASVQFVRVYISGWMVWCESEGVG